MRAPETLRDLRRGQVVAAARALIAEAGLEALTIGALENRLQFSRGVITYHFRNKEEIVEAVLESALAEIIAGAEADVVVRLTPPEKVAAVLDAMVRGWVNRPEAGRIMLSFWSRMVASPRLQELNARLYQSYRAASALLIEQGLERGAFRDDVSPQTMAAVLVGLVIGIVTQVYFEPDGIDLDASVAEAQRTILARLAPNPDAGRTGGRRVKEPGAPTGEKR